MNADAPAGTPCWHIHHDVLLEVATRPLQGRVDAILRIKPRVEHETRLRLMRPVEGELPEEVVEAAREMYDAYLAAEEAFDAGAESGDLDAAYMQAAARFMHALSDHEAAILTLHRVECPDCTWDGETIFPRTEVT